MSTHKKFYLLIGIFISLGSTIQANLFDHKVEITHENCDELLHHLIADTFFNDQETMAFSKIIGHLLRILEFKEKNVHDGHEAQYAAITKTLREHQYNYSIIVWANFFKDPMLLELLPQETVEFLDTIPWYEKARVLRNRLS